MRRAVEAKPTGIRTFIRTPMFTWTERTKQLKNRHCSYERQLFTSENERRLRTLFVNGVVSPAPGKQEHNLWCPFCWFSDVCAEHRSYGGVATMHNGTANKALVNVSNIGCGTSAKTHPQKYKLAPGKASCFFVFIFHSTCKNGLGQVERTHTRTLLRNAHLNTITVTKTCSKKRMLHGGRESHGGGKTLRRVLRNVLFHRETKGRFRQKGGFGECALVPGEHANVPSLQFLFRANMRTYPRSGFHFTGTSAKTTLLENHPFVNPRMKDYGGSRILWIRVP